MDKSQTLSNDIRIYFDYFRRLSNFCHTWVFSSIPLVIPQVSKNTLILAWLYIQLQPVIRGLWRRFGYRLTSIFQEKTEKIKFGTFETLRGHIFNYIGSAQRRNFLYCPYYLPIRKYAWKTAQNWFFCQFSKTSEKFAFSRKNLGGYLEHWWRCRKHRRNKIKLTHLRKIKFLLMCHRL